MNKLIIFNCAITLNISIIYNELPTLQFWFEFMITYNLNDV